MEINDDLKYAVIVATLLTECELYFSVDRQFNFAKINSLGLKVLANNLGMVLETMKLCEIEEGEEDEN